MPIRSLLLALVAVFAVSAAADAKSPVQLAPTEDHIPVLLMVNKKVGNEQWVLTLDADDGFLVGNVFDLTGKPPTFFYCDATFSPDNWTEPAEIAAETVTFQCKVAGGCTSLTCDADWTPIAQPIMLSGGFFLP